MKEEAALFSSNLNRIRISSSTPSNGLLNSTWMTTYCRLRRASQLMYVIDVTVYYNLIN